MGATFEQRRHHGNQFGTTRQDKIERWFLAGKRRAEQIDRLGQNRFGRNQPPPEIPEKRDAPLVVPLAPIEQRDERAGIQQQITHAGTGGGDVRGALPRDRGCRFPPSR